MSAARFSKAQWETIRPGCLVSVTIGAYVVTRLPVGLGLLTFLVVEVEERPFPLVGKPGLPIKRDGRVKRLS